LAVRAGRQGAPTLGYVPQNVFNAEGDLCKSRAKRGVESGLWPETIEFIWTKSRHSLDAKPFAEVSEGVASNPPPPDLTANHANHAKIKTEFSFVYLAYFAVHSASTPSEMSAKGDVFESGSLQR
jgi:hypothetical protein